MRNTALKHRLGQIAVGNYGFISLARFALSHAIYNEDVAAIDFMTGEVLEGYLPNKAMNMVQEWITIHKDTLIEIWKTQEFKKIPPLE